MSDPLLPLLLAIPTVIVACHTAGRAVRLLGQPPVVGEIVAGILLGKSLLGRLAPGAEHRLLPAAVLPTTSALGNLALLAFLFLIGLELDLRALRTSRRAVAAVSLASLLVPLACGTALATAMYPRLAPSGVKHGPFVLFIAVALSVTAFPVLARVLSDKGLQTTELGTFAMASAAVDDALAWCLLTAVVAVTTAASTASAGITLAEAAVLAAALLLARPGLGKALERAARSSDELVMAALFVGLCLTAYATDRIGIHPAFGAFLFGAAASRDVSAVERSAARLHAVVLPLLLPLYFVDTGLHTNLSTVSTSHWGWGAAILAVAVLGKAAGAAGAARLGGFSWRFAAATGTLMNCRGVTELVVLSIGRQIGVIGCR